MLRAGNQQGKTHAAGAQFTMDALALYPDWYGGRKFLTPPPIERPFEWMGWASCTTSTKTRDGAQLKLLGPGARAGRARHRADPARQHRGQADDGARHLGFRRHRDDAARDRRARR
jgi:hypothetical protein